MKLNTRPGNAGRRPAAATIHRLSRDPWETALIDRALRALIHVDYVLHTTAYVLAAPAPANP